MILQVHATTEAARVPLQIAGDPVAAIGMIEDDEVFGEPGLILLEAAHLDRSSGAAARGEEPVPIGQRAGLDVLDQRSSGAAAFGQW